MKRFFLALALLACATPTDAGVRVLYRPGGWTDIVRTPSGYEQVRATASEIVTEVVDGPVRWSLPLPESVLYLNAAVDDIGTVQAIFQGNASGNAYVAAAGGFRVLGPSFGQNATEIAWFPARGWVYYVQTSPTTYATYDAQGCAPCSSTMPQTSQGFRDIYPDGTVRRGDDYFSGVFAGRRLWEPMQRGDVTVGQCDPAAICAVAEGRAFSVIHGLSFEPHLTSPEGGRFAVAARTDAGAAVAIVEPPYPPADVITTNPPPPPSPPPVPVPSAQNQAPNRQSVVEDVIRAHPEIDTRDEDSLDKGRAVIVDWTAQRLNAAEGRVVWGRKSRGKPNGDRAVNPNTDGLTYLRSDGRFEIIDVIVGATGAATWENYGPFNPGDNGWWAPPQLGPERGSTPPPPPPPPPGGVTRADLDAAVAGLRAELAAARAALEDADRRLADRIAAVKPVDLSALQAAIDAALANLAVVGKTRTAFGHQHTIDLGVIRR